MSLATIEGKERKKERKKVNSMAALAIDVNKGPFLLLYFTLVSR